MKYVLRYTNLRPKTGAMTQNVKNSKTNKFNFEPKKGLTQYLNILLNLLNLSVSVVNIGNYSKTFKNLAQVEIHTIIDNFTPTLD